jgi:GGDEF domain-containing protein
MGQGDNLVGDVLLSEADNAMYDAKKAGKNTWQMRRLSAS